MLTAARGRYRLTRAGTRAVVRSAKRPHSGGTRSIEMRSSCSSRRTAPARRTRNGTVLSLAMRYENSAGSVQLINRGQVSRNHPSSSFTAERPRRSSAMSASRQGTPAPAATAESSATRASGVTLLCSTKRYADLPRVHWATPSTTEAEVAASPATAVTAAPHGKAGPRRSSSRGGVARTSTRR